MEYEWNTHTYICTYEGIFIPSFVYTYLYTFVSIPSKVFICYPAEGIYTFVRIIYDVYIYVRI